MKNSSTVGTTNVSGRCVAADLSVKKTSFAPKFRVSSAKPSGLHRSRSASHLPGQAFPNCPFQRNDADSPENATTCDKTCTLRVGMRCRRPVRTSSCPTGTCDFAAIGYQVRQHDVFQPQSEQASIRVRSSFPIAVWQFKMDNGNQPPSLFIFS